jgi:Pectate lyase
MAEQEAEQERLGPDFIPASGVAWTVKDDEPMLVLGWVHTYNNYYDPLTAYGQAFDAGGEVYDTKADAIEGISKWKEWLREQAELERQREKELERV